IERLPVRGDRDGIRRASLRSAREKAGHDRFRHDAPCGIHDRNTIRGAACHEQPAILWVKRDLIGMLAYRDLGYDAQFGWLQTQKATLRPVRDIDLSPSWAQNHIVGSIAARSCSHHGTTLEVDCRNQATIDVQ